MGKPNAKQPEGTHGGSEALKRDLTGIVRLTHALRIFALALTASFVVGSASAQIETQPSWAVLPFANLGDKAMPVGQMASDAFFQHAGLYGAN